MQKRFTGKTVWVSDAVQGIGRGIAEFFVEKGANIAIIDIKSNTCWC